MTKRRTKSQKIKICTKCKIGFSITIKCFPPRKDSKDGLSSWCKKCHREAQKKYRQSEKGKEYYRKFSKKYHSTINGYLRRIFIGMRQRCTNPKNPKYNRYGNRGIKILFKSVNEFVNHVINVLQVDPRGLQIDRINNNKHYEPGNIQFLTDKKHGEKHKKNQSSKN